MFGGEFIILAMFIILLDIVSKAYVYFIVSLLYFGDAAIIICSLFCYYVTVVTIDSWRKYGLKFGK